MILIEGILIIILLVFLMLCITYYVIITCFRVNRNNKIQYENLP